MNYLTFQRITRKGNFVAWKQEYGNEEVTAIAYMVEDAWFSIAINCMRDGDMGEKDADGVYERYWGGDSVWIDDLPRQATEKEIFLYLHKVGGRVPCGAVDSDNNPLPLVGNRCDHNFKYLIEKEVVKNKEIKKHEHWVNIYKNGNARIIYAKLFDSYKDAYEFAKCSRSEDSNIEYVDTVKLEWEE